MNGKWCLGYVTYFEYGVVTPMRSFCCALVNWQISLNCSYIIAKMQSIAGFWFADYGAKTVPHSICALCMCGCFMCVCEYIYIYASAQLVSRLATGRWVTGTSYFCYHPAKGSKNWKSSSFLRLVQLCQPLYILWWHYYIKTSKRLNQKKW